MTNRKLQILLCAAGLSLVAPAAMSGPVPTSQGQAVAARQQAALKGRAEKAQARVASSASAKEAFANAKTEREARALLMANGFTAKDLEGVAVKIDRLGSQGGGQKARKISVTITYRCCPSTITVTVRW